MLAHRLRTAAADPRVAPLSTLAAHALFAQLEREWPPGELSAALAAAEPAQRQGVCEEVGVALEAAPLLNPKALVLAMQAMLGQMTARSATWSPEARKSQADGVLDRRG